MLVGWLDLCRSKLSGFYFVIVVLCGFIFFNISSFLIAILYTSKCVLRSGSLREEIHFSRPCYCFSVEFDGVCRCSKSRSVVSDHQLEPVAVAFVFMLLKCHCVLSSFISSLYCTSLAQNVCCGCDRFS